MALIKSSFELPPDITQDWLNTKDYFNSYATVHYTAGADGSDASSSEFNPFEKSVYTGNGGTYTTNAVVKKSPDVDFDVTNGKFSVNIAGDYWVCWIVNVLCASSTTTAVAKIKKNNSDIFESDSAFVTGPSTPGAVQIVCTQIVSLAAGDVIHGTINGAASITATVGTSLTIMRCGGLYGHAKYTASANAQTAYNNITAFNNSFSGTVSTTTNGVTFNNNPGKFEPSKTRIFLFLSTLVSQVASANECLEHKLTVDGSSTGLDQMTFGTTAGTDPSSHTVAILKEVKDDERAEIKRSDLNKTTAGCGNSTTPSAQQDPIAYTFTKGTNWSFIDISNNGGLPKAFICGTLDNSSDAFTNNTSTSMSIYKADNYDSGADFDFIDPNSNAELGGNRNIVFNSIGQFMPSPLDDKSLAGDYLVISFVGIQSVSTNQACTHALTQAGGTVNERVESAFQQIGASTNFDPVNNVIVSIVQFDRRFGTYALEAVQPQIKGLQGKITDGTGFIMFKLGPRMTKQTGDNEFFSGATLGQVDNTQTSGQPIVQTNNTIDSADKGDQRDRRTEQSPFRMAVNGPLTLRGRARSSLPFSVGAGKRGDEK